MHAALPFHPLAALFQLTDGEAYAALVEDIRARGLLQPIVLYQGMILDGRNRYRACLDACVAVRTVTYEGDDPLGFICSLNLRRRHSSESQCAMGATRLAKLPKGRPGKSAPVRICSEEAA
jgi:hypothetical protein